MKHLERRNNEQSNICRDSVVNRGSWKTAFHSNSAMLLRYSDYLTTLCIK